ncbi:hypothetical protein [Nocardia vermiculata]|uniref:ESX-1 secretion-associated protein n=1 Tax=Nocardia vermiculata TaxID=257274 RepID=A0A846XSX3_9NOCA|nr:hypothetical protein [Nocardia vermiculata]NKY49717.1 hypothetical protein [Nocardia vermiculata]
MSELTTLKQLGAEIEAGNLRLRVDRAHFDAAIKGLQDLIDELDAFGPDIENVAVVTGFGGFQMGVDLARKFTVKGSGEGSIKQRIQEAQDELRAAQDVLRKAVLAYVETDDELRKQFQGIAP